MQLYKLGRAGYWRLLLDVDDLRTIGRAYRTAAALTELDRERCSSTSGRSTRWPRSAATLEARSQELTALQTRRRPRARALDRAVAEPDARSSRRSTRAAT